MNKPRICLVAHLYPRNDEDYKGVFVRDMAVELARQGFEVHIVTARRPGATQRETSKDLHVHRFPYWGWQKGIQLGELKGTPVLLLGSLVLMGILKCVVTVLKYKACLIHAYWVVPGGLIGMISGRLTRRPIVATAAGSDLNLASRRGLTRLLVRLTLKNIDRMIAVSNSLKQKAFQLGLSQDRCRVVPWAVGVETPALPEPHHGKPYAKETKKRLLYAGNLTPPKRVDTIIEAMDRVVREFPDCRLDIVGDGHLRPQLEALAARLGITQHVRFLGPLPHERVLAMMQRADLFVHCSEHEGLPVAIMEAMSAGLPVVASRLGGVPDLVHEGKTGYMVTPDDTDGYAKKILLLLKNEPLRFHLGANGNAFAEQKLSKRQVVSTLKSVYTELMKHSEVVAPSGEKNPWTAK
jgi:glycosyltransferase involved in cell wall biosynthesis